MNYNNNILTRIIIKYNITYYYAAIINITIVKMYYSITYFFQNKYVIFCYVNFFLFLHVSSAN